MDLSLVELCQKSNSLRYLLLASHSRITTDTGPTRTVTPHTKLDYRNTIEPPTTLLHACDPHRISYRHPTQATFCSVPVRASRLGLCTVCPPPHPTPRMVPRSPHLPPHPPPHVQLCHHRHWRRLREKTTESPPGPPLLLRGLRSGRVTLSPASP